MFFFGFQCETMGLQATSPPTSPLHRPPPPLNTMLKRKHDCVEDDDDEDVLMSVTTSGVKKICVEVVASSSNKQANSDEDIEDFSDDEANSSSSSDNDSIMDDSIMITTSNESTASEDENKENQVNVNKLKELDSILAKTLLNSTQVQNSTAVQKPNDNCPKVIVEHKPLPSIYDLQQMSAACETLEDNANNIKENDSGVSDDEEDEVSDDLDSGDDEEDDEDHPSPSPIFDPVLRGTGKQAVLPSPPKAIYDQRSGFWSSNPQQYSSNQNTFQFLEQTTQRIECAENGKSYLQLGTMNHAAAHHHLPVTPVIQPKPNMVYRRPIPPFSRNTSIGHHPGHHNLNSSNSRPVCDHTNCLQKKQSFCYQSQRSRMLNLSLSKLHMARQSHDGSLRRSVLICNMLRYIEDETDREAINDNSQTAYDDHHSAYWSQQRTQQTQQPQTPPQTPPPQAQVAPPPPQPTQPTQQQISAADYNMTSQQSTPQYNPNSRETQQMETYVEPNPLKDFNSAFRSTPYSSPAHPGSDMDSGLGLNEHHVTEVERGINWSSVLSLTSSVPSELDPLNNNTFATEAWPNTANTPTTLPTSGPPPTLTDSSSASTCTTTTVVNGTSFDDIGWKLSADDVLKAFPNDENLFVTGP